MPVLSPAVAAGEERLRTNLTSEHTRRDVDAALDVLARGHALLAETRSGAGR